MSNPNHHDEQAIRDLMAVFEQGWNAGDGEICGRPFAENADFTAVSGLRARGRDLIARGHAEILASVFRGTHMTATVNDVTFLRPDVATADVTLRLTAEQPVAWLPPYTCCGIVAVRENGRWAIVNFRNFVPFDRPAAGPIDRELLRASRPAELTV